MDENEENNVNAIVIGAATAVISTTLFIFEELRYMSTIPRQPYVNRDGARLDYINSILYSGDTHCHNQIRVRPEAFFSLCNILVEKRLLEETIHMSVVEQVLMFLHILGHNVRFRVVGGRFHRSSWTVHHYFHSVLQAVLKLYPEVVKLADTSTPPQIQRNPRFYPWFEDCIGALDGTHVPASVPIEAQDRYRGRKGWTSQNVLAAVSFDLKFQYVLAGWEGSAHDARILNDALSRPGGLKVPEGKYFLLDAGYGIRSGFIPPYRGVRYHLNEYANQAPQDAKELFNLRHSSLRTTVERAFGILKKRFRVLDSRPFWSYETQVDVVLASCILHNFIVGVDPNDLILRDASSQVPNQTQTQRASLSQREERLESREWSMKRDAIANAMFMNYRNRRSTQNY